MSDGTGANPIEAMQGGEYAEALATAMAGLADMFDMLVDDAATDAGHDDVASGFRSFKENHSQDFIDVQNHGLDIADHIQDGAAHTAETDVESQEDFERPWEALEELKS